MIDSLAKLIPPELAPVSGSVFYSGGAAYSGKSKIYILGANPGGDPIARPDETIKAHTDFVLNDAPRHWSAYCDESWADKPAGEAPMQRRLRHLFARLELDPRRVPASNLVFYRSRRLSELDGSFDRLIDLCWPLHEAVLAHICPRAILCFGVDTGRAVAKRIGAIDCVGSFQEDNGRRWRSRAWRNPTGMIVFGLTHPSVADWTNPKTDPTPMIMKELGGNGRQDE